MKSKFEQIDISDPKHLEALEQVAAWSEERPTMKAYSLEELKQCPLGVVAFEELDEKLLGHVAITEIDKIAAAYRARIGALAVAKAYQGNGVAEQLVRNILGFAQTALPHVDSFYANIHEGSLKAFSKNGAEIVRNRVPPSETGCNTVVSIPNPYEKSSGL